MHDTDTEDLQDKEEIQYLSDENLEKISNLIIEKFHDVYEVLAS